MSQIAMSGRVVELEVGIGIEMLLDPSLKLKNVALEPDSQQKWLADSNGSFLTF